MGQVRNDIDCHPLNRLSLAVPMLLTDSFLFGLALAHVVAPAVADAGTSANKCAGADAAAQAQDQHGEQERAQVEAGIRRCCRPRFE